MTILLNNGAKMNRFKEELTQISGNHRLKVRFAIVGVWNTVFGYGVFWLLDNFFAVNLKSRVAAYMWATVLSQVMAIINAFIFHKYITFKSLVRGLGIVLEFFRFCLTYVVAFFLGLLLMPFFVEVFSFDPKVSAALIIAICMAVSYLGHFKFSFNQPCKKNGHSGGSL